MTTTTLDISSTVENDTIVIARDQIECQREFSISSETDLAVGNVKTNYITADLATLTLLSSHGELT